jgi:predicted nucleotidyltransferase
MALSKNEAVNIVKGFLDNCSHRGEIDAAYVFGSFARGEPKPYSDIDLAVVLRAPREPESSLYGEEFEIFHEAQKYNSLIEVVCFRTDRFGRGDDPIVEEIKTAGVKML